MLPTSAVVIVAAGGAPSAAAYGGPSLVTPRVEYVQVLRDQQRTRVVAWPRVHASG